MSIQFIKKDISTVEVGIIAHGVNCQGVMGSGVAKVLRDKWPKIFERYTSVCDFYGKLNRRGSMLGQVNIVDVGEEEGQLYVANCFTQEYYGKDGKVYADLKAIQNCFKDLFELSIGLNLPLFLPRIGCGLGGLDWDKDVGVVLKDVDVYFNYCAIGDADVYVCDL